MGSSHGPTSTGACGRAPPTHRAPSNPSRARSGERTSLALLQNRRAARLDDPVPSKFKAGDAVLARNVNPAGHTRIPRYVRGRRGVVDRDHGVFIFPDTHAAGLGRKPQHVYSVRFAADELWGPDGHAKDAVYVDLWDDYLDPA